MDPIAAMVGLTRDAMVEAVRRYNRLDIEVMAPVPDEPCLVVANHGFGGIVDLNVFATMAALDQVTDRPVTALTHQIAWTLRVGGLLEHVGAVPAGPDAAHLAFEQGHHVLVMPGGDLDASKPWHRRNSVDFFGRSGFARLASQEGVPILPIVTAGAGESLLVLSDGAGLAKRLNLPSLLRMNTMPVSVSIPWGINVGVVGLLPYLPLPTKLDTAVLPALQAYEDESPHDLAERVRAAMQAALDERTAGRVPVIGRIEGDSPA